VGGLNENGLLVINSSRTKDEIIGSFPSEMRELISKRKIKIIVLDATRTALKHLKRNLPGAMMLGLINGETKILSVNEFGNRFQNILEQKLGPKKGREIVESNIALLNEGAKLAASTPEQMSGAFAGVSDRKEPVAAVQPEDFGKGYGTAGLRSKLSQKDEMGTIKPVNLIEDYQKLFNEDMVKPILEGKNVSWDRFLPVVPSATSRFRDMSYIGSQIPVWDAKKCIACGMCAALCPDSAIYSTITDKPIPDDAADYFKVFKKPPRGIPWGEIRHEPQRY